MILPRRALLKMAAAGASLAATSVQARRDGTPPLGLADITVTKDLARDYAGTLMRIAALGYSHFGFRMGAYRPDDHELPPTEKARLVRAAGMAVGVVRFPAFGNRDSVIDQAVAIGAKVIAISSMPPFAVPGFNLPQTPFADWLPQLAALGAKCRTAGLRLAFHTHWWDFKPNEHGESPLDIIVRSIPPADLGVELDLGWCWYGGADPLGTLARLGPRVTSMHFKDIDRKHGATISDHAVVIGSGEMDYAKLLPKIRPLTSAIGYVEVDSPADGLVAAAEAIRFFRANV